MKEFKEEEFFRKNIGASPGFKKNIQIRGSTTEVFYRATLYLDALSMICCVYRFLWH